MFPKYRPTVTCATMALSLFASAMTLRADLLDARMFNTAEYTQTASGTTFQNYSFEMDVITQSSSTTFTSAQVTYPGPGSPAILNPAPGDQFFNTYFGPYSSLTSLHQALPFGNYTTSFSNGTITDSATINYAADHFQSAIPSLTSASYAAIQSMNPTQAITLNFNSFTPDPALNGAVGTYVNIFAPNGSEVFTTFVAPNVTSVTVPANTLQSDTTYTLNINQGGRIVTPANGEGVETELGFALNDNVLFTTGPGLGLITVAPCRLVDTRGSQGPLGGPSLAANSTRTFPLPSGACGLPSDATAYSLNITVLPKNGKLGYLTVWPTGQPQPTVSTLNSLDGRVVANAAIVPAGTSGAVSVFVTDETDVLIDVSGYFSSSNTSGALYFQPVTPCRVEDTRNANGTFGGPILAADSTRSFPIPDSNCGIPSTASAYSLNATVVPTAALQYLTLFPTGAMQPTVSTLNAMNGQVVANAAIVAAGTNGAVSAFVTNQTNLITDINGFFASAPSSPSAFIPVEPCRLVDTRGATGTFGGPMLAARSTRSFPIPDGACGLPADATAYAFNVTVVPAGPLQYLTIWPDGQPQPVVSTLNSPNGQVVANAALVPSGNNGSVDVYVTNQTQVVIDVVGYFVSAN